MLDRQSPTRIKPVRMKEGVGGSGGEERGEGQQVCADICTPGFMTGVATAQCLESSPYRPPPGCARDRITATSTLRKRPLFFVAMKPAISPQQWESREGAPTGWCIIFITVTYPSIPGRRSLSHLVGPASPRSSWTLSSMPPRSTDLGRWASACRVERRL